MSRQGKLHSCPFHVETIAKKEYKDKYDIKTSEETPYEKYYQPSKKLYKELCYWYHDKKDVCMVFHNKCVLSFDGYCSKYKHITAHDKYKLEHSPDNPYDNYQPPKEKKKKNKKKKATISKP